MSVITGAFPSQMSYLGRDSSQQSDMSVITGTFPSQMSYLGRDGSEADFGSRDTQHFGSGETQHFGSRETQRCGSYDGTDVFDNKDNNDRLSDANISSQTPLKPDGSFPSSDKYNNIEFPCDELSALSVGDSNLKLPLNSIENISSCTDKKINIKEQYLENPTADILPSSSSEESRPIISNKTTVVNSLENDNNGSSYQQFLEPHDENKDVETTSNKSSGSIEILDHSDTEKSQTFDTEKSRTFDTEKSHTFDTEKHRAFDTSSTTSRRSSSSVRCSLLSLISPAPSVDGYKRVRSLRRIG